MEVYKHDSTANDSAIRLNNRTEKRQTWQDERERTSSCGTLRRNFDARSSIDVHSRRWTQRLSLEDVRSRQGAYVISNHFKSWMRF